MRFRKLAVCLLAVAVAALGTAQTNPDGSMDDKFECPPALYMGTCHLQPVTDGTPGNMMPTNLLFAVINSQYSWDLTLFQDAYYQLMPNGKYELQTRSNPIGFNSLSAGSNNGTATSVNLLSFFGTWVWGQRVAHPDYMTGTYRWRLRVNQAGVGIMYIREWRWDVGKQIQWNANQFQDASSYANGALDGSDGSGNVGSGGSTGSTGGVGANAPTEEEQNNFWTNLFVPDHEHLDSIKLKLLQWSSWGPFGIYTAISGKFNDSFSADADAYKIHLYTPVIAWNPDGQISTAGTWTVGDLTPYSGMIGFIRLVIAGSMWMFALFLVYKRFIAKAA